MQGWGNRGTAHHEIQTETEQRQNCGNSTLLPHADSEVCKCKGQGGGGGGGRAGAGAADGKGVRSATHILGFKESTLGDGSHNLEVEQMRLEEEEEGDRGNAPEREVTF